MVLQLPLCTVVLPLWLTSMSSLTSSGMQLLCDPIMSPVGNARKAHHERQFMLHNNELRFIKRYVYTGVYDI